jgi:hypothetical protein
MKLEQAHWTADDGWQRTRVEPIGGPAQLVLVFGDRFALGNTSVLEELEAMYPGAPLVGCSTSGEIRDTRVYDGTVVATAMHLERSSVQVARVTLDAADDGLDAGRRLAHALRGPDLVHVLVLSDGLRVNGSALVRGLEEALPEGVTLSGGLAGDAARFESTSVCSGAGARPGEVAAVGFYGAGLRVGCASLGGWDAFGPDRVVTRSEGKVLYELDGMSALTLYKNYLGQYAADLPSSGLLFPLIVRTGPEQGVVRTILGIDETAGSITCAGDIPEGSYARLTKANFDRLIDGAGQAAAATDPSPGAAPADLAILISCVGRKLVLGQRTEEEVECVRETVGERAVLTGFYSYGEISPFTPLARCKLHNQTMAVTTISEN